MKIIPFLLCLFFVIQLNAQNELYHTISVNLTSKESTETIEVKATSDYLFRIEKDKVIDGKTFSYVIVGNNHRAFLT